MSTTDAIRDLIIDDLGWVGDRSQLTDDYPLLENEVIDSLGIFQIVTFIESQYGIEVDIDQLTPENFESLGTIARLITR